MKTDARRKARWTLLMAAMLAGGTLFATCELRVRDSVVDGTKRFLLSLLNPSNLAIDFSADATNPTDGS